MIVTLTPNTAVDYTLVVPELALNATLRARDQAWGMGGKAADAAWILGKLGEPVLALGCAAGPLGGRMEALLRAQGVTTDFVRVDGETRLNVVLVCADGSGQTTFTAPGLRVTAEQQARLEARYTAALDGANCVVLGGSLPAGLPADFFAGCIRQARARGLPVIFDASGAALRGGLPGGPTLIKPNRDELGELLNAALAVDEVPAAARRLQQMHGCDVVVTLGAAGAVAVLGERAYQIPALSLPIASSAGAGDGVLAGLALAHARAWPLEEGLRHGFALAGAVVQTLATADFRVEDYEALLPRVALRRLA